MIKTDQVLAIIIATLGVTGAFLALTAPNLERLFADWRIRLGGAMLGMICLIGGIWGVPYYAHAPKTVIDSGREVIGKGTGAARDGMKRLHDALPKAPSWWPWAQRADKK